MKKKILLAVLTVGMMSGEAFPIWAYTPVAYDVEVPQEFKVPFAEGKEGYFENGLVTGFGSAVTFKGYNENGEMEFYAVTDRGPNADAPQYSADGNVTDAKIFPCPEFTPSIAILTIKDEGAVVTSVIELKDEQGNNITGLPLEPGQVGSTNETALDMEMNNIGFDSNGLDTEGIAVDKDGNFWVCDEYGPFIAKFDSEGTLLEKYAPGDGLPEILENRIPNRGFEGLTITPSGKILASVQSVLDVNGETSKTACFTRIVELDPETKETKMYAYPVEISKYKSAKDCKIGDIYSIDDNTLLVIEQGTLSDGSMSNVICKVDLTDATDITDVAYNDKTLEYVESAEELDINFIKAEKLVDLREQGWTAEKAEGICMAGDDIVVINDNDFGIVTKVEDEENPDADIMDYVYDSASGKYFLDEKEASVKISLEENTEPAQLWILKEK
ncbi:esterase-like activity of phytase family protein [Ruminococcus sp. 5_1_39BFAA]|uniref:esterase-like activity of phytase family protein n=1 Tax=Ruminococcus sp. 5_1_39BFAA TaxID=457412 RepID=UPI0035651C94